MPRTLRARFGDVRIFLRHILTAPRSRKNLATEYPESRDEFRPGKCYAQPLNSNECRRFFFWPVPCPAEILTMAHVQPVAHYPSSSFLELRARGFRGRSENRGALRAQF
jgi:hypothetical protein